MALRGVASQDLLQQLQRQLKTLTVDKLKKILRNSELTITGTKAILIQRISNELNRRSQGSDATGFSYLSQLIQNPDNPPTLPSGSPPSTDFSAASGSGNYAIPQNNSDLSGRHVPQYLQSPTQSGALNFKQTPFYTIVEPIGNRKQLDPREQSRQVLEFSLRMKGDVIERIRRDRKMRIMLYSGTEESLRGPADISFPANFELKVNGTEMRANFKGLKNKPGTTRPVDITALLSQNMGQDNQIWVVWAVTTKRFYLMLYLTRQVFPDELVRKLKEAKSISKLSVIGEMGAWADDNDLMTTSSRMSLRCPLSTIRIETPCRSRICKHSQCFDALSFLQLQEQAPQWNCPVCNKHVPFEILQVDEYFNDILQNTPRTAEQVSIEPDGRWSLIKEELEPTNSPSWNARYEPTRQIGDVIELDDVSSAANFGSAGLQLASQATTPQRATFAPSSSTLSVQGTKRNASEVIDLTEDTDEEEEMGTSRPLKKQMTDGANEFDWRTQMTRPTQEPAGYQNGYSFTIPKQSSLPYGSNFGM